MRQAQLIDYITEGIIDFLHRQPVVIPSDASHEVAQMVLIREYIALRFAPDQELVVME